jgi:hypothetical protein
MNKPPSKKASSTNRTAVDCALYPLSSAGEDSEEGLGWSTATVIVTTSRRYEISGKSDSDVDEEIERIRRDPHPTTVEGMRRTTSIGGVVRSVTVKSVSDPVTEVEEVA